LRMLAQPPEIPTEQHTLNIEHSLHGYTFLDIRSNNKDEQGQPCHMTLESLLRSKRSSNIPCDILSCSAISHAFPLLCIPPPPSIPCSLYSSRFLMKSIVFSILRLRWRRTGVGPAQMKMRTKILAVRSFNIIFS
jgi:hypothetical protein